MIYDEAKHYQSIYVSDLDGTLFDNRGKISNEGARIINALIRNGMNFTVATAKSYNSIKNELNKLDLRLPVITFDGAHVCQPDGSTLLMQSLPLEQELKVASVLDALNVNILVYKLQENNTGKSVFMKVNKDDNFIETYLKKRKNDRRLSIVSDPVFEKHLPTAFIATIGSYDDILYISSVLTKHCIYNFYINADTYISGMYWLKISNEKAKKSFAIKEIMSIFGFKSLTTFGDSENDIDMLMQSNRKIVVSNASPALQKIADEVIGDNNSNSVAYYLREKWRC